MASVYAATNTWTERRVAIKILHPELSRDGSLANRFLREARIATRIAHPNIVDILDMGQDPADGTLFLVQELLQGNDLRSLLDAMGKLDLQSAFGILIPVMSALVAAQAKGVVHRDLKPENLFLVNVSTGSVFPKIIDFGIAKISDDGFEKGLTKTGASMGTPYYMSPEQAKGAKDIDAQTDVWALGVIWFEILTGRCPYEADNYNQLIAKILIEEPPRLSEYASSVPASVSQAIQRAIEKERGARWRSVREFLAAILSAQEIQSEPWLQALKVTFGTHDASTTAEYASISEDASRRATEKALNQLPVARAEAHAINTIAQAATEIDAKPNGVKFGAFLVGTFGVIGLAIAGFAIGLTRPKPPGSTHSTAPTSASIRQASAVARTSAPAGTAQPQQARATFSVLTSLHPDSASAELDGQRLQANPVSQTLELDGRNHILRVFAPGFQEQVVQFRDLPPPASVVLSPLNTAVIPAHRGRGRHPSVPPTTTAAPSAATAPPTTPTPPAPPPSAPAGRPTINGAPVLGL